ncbi:hypothetical protein FH972_023648 [Carpinus fangiana]|uniref:Chromatin-remodeling ATPase INO80 n=1 Tax=Carpinus fangiana TaxID=176857 RepID=A0A5N6KWA7_9ROSI|nr:hypothetical protein FH972_023648 [Carpinus fangiana]
MAQYHPSGMAAQGPSPEHSPQQPPSATIASPHHHYRHPHPPHQAQPTPFYNAQPQSPQAGQLPALNGHTSQPPPRQETPGTFYDPITGSRTPRAAPPTPSHASPSHLPAPPTHPSAAPTYERRPHEGRDVVSPSLQHLPAGSRSSPPGHRYTTSNGSMGPPTAAAAAAAAAAAPAAAAPAESRPTSNSSAPRGNAMSLSSILSSSDDRAAPEAPSAPSQKPPHAASITYSRSDAAPAPPPPRTVSQPPAFGVQPPNGASEYPPYAMQYRQEPSSHGQYQTNGVYDPTRPPPAKVSKPLPVISEREYEKALAMIESMDHGEPKELMDGFRDEYFDMQLLRIRKNDAIEVSKRKRRRIAFLQDVSNSFTAKADLAKDRYFAANEKDTYDSVVAEDVARDKERKKINQRTRRREGQKQRHEQQVAALMEKAEMASTEEERQKLLTEAKKAEKRAIHTTRLLNGEEGDDMRDTTPNAPSVGGITGSFDVITEDGSQEPPKKRARVGGRLKKSREQKQAEKDQAAAAFERGDGDHLVALAPKGDATSRLKRDSLARRGSTPGDKTIAPPTKAYDQLYDAIWKDIARNKIPKVLKIKDTSLATKQSNLKKTSQLASKEARRWQLKTNKSQKDTQARAKRAMREMLGFWKRNEREERDQRKMAERAELENAKKAEADREANRQKRKLNFLISQTELYSHFIGKKVKTDEAERSSDNVGATEEKLRAGDANAHTINLPESNANLATKVTNFEDLDFDAEDESVLQQAAMANAQNAVQEAQNRARAFNNGGEPAEGSNQQQFDDMDGEMNFQNPTSLQSMDIAQPKMLSCQLKEYQLKGLNWLVNLYEQGINGILADEMGLGKTVQSISVMAYLAEAHNIWGPFLVIAPASTLHNWQQEIAKFVPNLKTLPYWGNAKDRKVLRKFWDRKHITYSKDSSFHVLVTSYQLVVQDAQYFQKIRWQYMILDEAQAIKSSQSSRWKSLLGFHCRNRLLLTGTPIQNNMQELWALLHFIMPSLFDSHDEFSDWFSKDIESHAQSNTKLNEDQLRRLHMILKPFMLRRIKKHVQKELGDKIEKDVFCDLTYRQRAYYSNLRNKISIMDLIEKAAVGDDQDTATLMNLVMQFRKVCNHPDLFERADTTSPMSFCYFAETASFMREGHSVDVGYSVRNQIELKVPRLIGRDNGRLDVAGPDNDKAGWRNKYLYHMMNIWQPENILKSSKNSDAFSWLPLADLSVNEASAIAHRNIFDRAEHETSKPPRSGWPGLFDEDDKENDLPTSTRNMLDIVTRTPSTALSKSFGDGYMHKLLNISEQAFGEQGLNAIEPCSRPAATAPPIELYCASQASIKEKQQTFFNVPIRRSLFGISQKTEEVIVDQKIDPAIVPSTNLLPEPLSNKSKYTHIQVPSMRRFVTDSGKLAKLDELLRELKEGGHRVLLYFQMTRMIDLMEEYLTYRNYKYCRLDGSTKLEDRRDTVADFQANPEIFVFLLSTRAGGLGINLTAADTVIFYDSDWNPTIDSQAMDRAHRLGQTRQVTVYRMITRGTIEERIRRRALQKEEVQRVVISGGAGAGVDFNTRSRENRTKDIAMWLADDDQAAEIERKEVELAEKEAREGPSGKVKKKSAKKAKEVSLDDMYHEGEGNFNDGNDGSKPSGAATPVTGDATPVPGGRGKKGKGMSKKAKTAAQKLAIIDGTA